MENNKWFIDFGRRLKAEREKLGLTQHSLAKKALTKQHYVAQLERGIRNPSLRTVVNLLSALDISADHLIFGSREIGEKSEKIKSINDFLARRSVEEISSYYEIIRFLAPFIDDTQPGLLAMIQLLQKMRIF